MHSVRAARWWWSLATLLALLAGCEAESAASADATAGADAGSDSALTQAVALTIAATVGGVEARCGTVYSGLGSNKTGAQASAQLADARLFVSNLALQNAAGQWVAVALDASIWHRDGVALLDLEDATAACKDTGTPETNRQLTGKVPAGTYTALRFEVGVPFAQNHSDNALSDPPLSTPGMFWTWQAGYKFVRVDWKLASGKRWNVHVGSTGCVSASPVQAPKAPCAKPNRAQVVLPLPAGPEATLQLDLGQLLHGVDLANDTTGTAAGCMSGVGEAADCAPSWQALGMDFATGSCAADCAGQTLWQVAP